MSSKTKESKKESNLMNVEKLEKKYRNVSEELRDFRNAFLSSRMFLLGIAVGIMGNVFTSYLVELHFWWVGEKNIDAIIYGLGIAGMVLVVTVSRYRAHVDKRIEKAITELEINQRELEKQIENGKLKEMDKKNSNP